MAEVVGIGVGLSLMGLGALALLLESEGLSRSNWVGPLVTLLLASVVYAGLVALIVLRIAG
jgi:hypothetical protein